MRTLLAASLASWCPLGVLAGEVPKGAGVAGALPEAVPSFLENAPSEANHVAPALFDVVATFRASVEAKRAVKQVRTEQDGIAAKLATIAGELKVLAEHRQQLDQQMTLLQRQHQEQFEMLKRDLEAKLEAELAQVRQQLSAELEQEFSREVEAFDSRHREAIEQGLGQELELKERELQQLSQEIEAHTQDLLSRLAQLEPRSELAEQLERSMNEAVTRRKAELEARRARLQAERDAVLAKQRGEFVAALRQRQAPEEKRRVTLKEAALRQSMAELFQKTRLGGTAQLEGLQRALDEAGQQHNKLAQRQAVLAARAEALEKDATSGLQRMEGIEAERRSSFARLEQAFQRPHAGFRPEAITWFSEAIQRVPPELSTELGLLQQRVVRRMRQEEQLQEQRRVLRERQLALQLSREMEAKHQQFALERQREQEGRSRQAEELLAKAGQLAARGRFDDAIQLVSQAQALNPPQVNRLNVAREEFLAAKEQAARQAQAAKVERLFAHAMEVFQQGRYDDAVTLFEQVITQEAAVEGSARAGGVSTP